MTNFITLSRYALITMAAALLSFSGICVMSYKLISGPLWQVILFDFTVAFFGLCCLLWGGFTQQGVNELEDDGYEL